MGVIMRNLGSLFKKSLRRAPCIQFTVLQLFLIQTIFAAGMPRKPLEFEPLRSKFSIEKIKVARTYRAPFDWSSSYACKPETFAGTFAENTVFIKAEAAGGDGKYTHELYYSFGDSYQINSSGDGKIFTTQSGNGTFKVRLPKLKENIPFAMQLFMLISKDSTGRVSTFEKTIKVSRPVILTASTDEDSTQKNCRQVFPPQLSSEIPPQTNGSSSVSSLDLTFQDEGSVGSTRGGNLGITISPLSYAGFSSLFYVNSTLMIQKTQQRAQRTSYSAKYEIKPGETLEVYDQSVLSLVSHDASIVDPCGQEEVKKGIYRLHDWETLHHVHVSTSNTPNTPNDHPIGLTIENTCK